MLLTRWSTLCVTAGLAIILSATLALRAEPPKEKPAEEEPRVTVAAARERAKLLHTVYSSTLEVIHQRYFHINRSTVPARAMEDIFDDMSRQKLGKARWISVNTRAMSIDHEPESSFEKQAVREIIQGKEDIEVVEEGYYRRATAIPLSGGCVSCHAGFGVDQTRTPRFAGLVISIPVQDE